MSQIAPWHKIGVNNVHKGASTKMHKCFFGYLNFPVSAQPQKKKNIYTLKEYFKKYEQTKKVFKKIYATQKSI